MITSKSSKKVGKGGKHVKDDATHKEGEPVGDKTESNDKGGGTEQPTTEIHFIIASGEEIMLKDGKLVKDEVTGSILSGAKAKALGKDTDSIKSESREIFGAISIQNYCFNI